MNEEHTVIRRYLLGYSDSNTAESIEERLITDARYLEEFSIITDELIEDYIDGALTRDEASQFETHFLTTPRRQQKLRVTKALAERATGEQVHGERDPQESQPLPTNVSRLPAPAHRQKQWLIAAMVSAFLIAGFLVSAILQQRSTQFNAGNQLEAELARLNDPSLEYANDTSPQVTISPVTTRGFSEDRRVTIQPDTQTVLVRLILVDKIYDTYQVSLETADGTELGKAQQIKPTIESAGQFLKVRLPAQLLTASNYRIKLTATTPSGTSEDVGVYPFQIVKQ